VTSWIQISQLAVIEKSSDNNSTYFVFDSKTLQPIKEAIVKVGLTSRKDYTYELSSLSNIGKTNENGKLTAKYKKHDISVVSINNDATVLIDDSDTLEYAGYKSPENLKTYVYTDRPIYKPGDTVEWKSISRDTSNSTLSVLDKEELSFDLIYEDDSIISNSKVELNSFGTASGSFILPPNSKLGGYRIVTRGGSSSIQIERYVKSPFKVTLTSSSLAYTVPQNALINLKAERFEGLPLSSAKVELSSISQNNIYYCEEYEDECSYDDRFENNKTLTIPNDGILSVPIPLVDIFSNDN